MLPRYHMNENAAEQMKDKGKFVDIRLLSEQPPDGWTFARIEELAGCYYAMFTHPDYDDDGYLLTYPSGPYRCTETWQKNYTEDGKGYYVYKAGTKTSKDGIQYMDFTWNSPATMPASAIRYNDVKIKTVVKRLSELTAIEYIELPFPKTTYPVKEFKQWWNVTLGHAKPILTKDKTRYEAFPYSFDSAVQDDYIANIYSRADLKGLVYKGKPLTISAGPVVQFIKGKGKTDARD